MDREKYYLEELKLEGYDGGHRNQRSKALFAQDRAAVQRFFAQSSVPQTECDGWAKYLLGDTPEPMVIAGCGSQSYTLCGGPDHNTIVQFRKNISRVDLPARECARNTFPLQGLTARPYLVLSRGPLDNPLQILAMRRLPGVRAEDVYERGDWQAETPSGRLENTIVDLAGIYGRLWTSPVLFGIGEKSEWYRLENKNMVESQELLPMFAEELKEASDCFITIIGENWKFNLANMGLVPGHILIDPKTGRITGLPNWVHAQIVPFGLDFWAMEFFFGRFVNQKWEYYPCEKACRRLFWQTLLGVMEAKSRRIVPYSARRTLFAVSKAGMVSCVSRHYRKLMFERKVLTEKDTISDLVVRLESIQDMLIVFLRSADEYSLSVRNPG
ncbi:MAG: hypothetical protein M1820_008793 [Bogoriella megaspora]|nr:MAG: hypothetical protein M1820_008793 [Bogoriella megaspora]